MVVSSVRSRRALAVLVTSAAALGSGLVSGSVSTASAQDAGQATVPFRYAVSAKKHGKQGTRLTRLVIRGLPADATLTITCFPAGTGGCPASGTLPAKASAAGDGTQTFRVATKRLRDFPRKAVIAIGASAPDLSPRSVQLQVRKPGVFAEQNAGEG